MPIKGLFTVVLPMLIVGLVFVSFYQEIGQFFQGHLTSPQSAKGPTIGKIVAVGGRVQIRSVHESEYRELTKRGETEVPVYHLDTIQVENRSRVAVQLNNGYELDFIEPTKVIIELYDAANPESPVYLNFLRGDYRVQQSGKPDKLFAIKNGVRYSSTEKITRPKPDLIIRQNVSASQEESNSKSTAPPDKNNETPDSSQNKGSQSRIQTATVEKPVQEIQRRAELSSSLSNVYIDSVIQQQVEQFQRCQANSLRENALVKGNLLVGITIEPSGLMQSAQVLHSNLSDKQLTACVISVFKRLRFKSFTGSPIKRSYPISFE